MGIKTVSFIFYLIGGNKSKNMFHLKNIKKRYLLYFSLFPIILLTGSTASSAYNEEIIDYINVQNIFQDIFLDLGWGIMTGLSKFLDGLYSAITTLITLDFVNDIPAVSEFTSKISPVAWLVLSLCLVLGAIFLMVMPDKVKISEFARSVFLSVLLIIAMPFTIQTLNEFKEAGINDMNVELNNDGNDTVGKAILRSITIDINASQSGKAFLSDSVDPYRIKLSSTLANKDPWIYKVVPLISSDPEGRAKEKSYQIVYGMSETQYNNLCIQFTGDEKGLVKTLNKNSVLGYDEEGFFEDLTTDWSQKLEEFEAMRQDYYQKYLEEESNTVSTYALAPLAVSEFNLLDNTSWGKSTEYIYAYHTDFFNGAVILLVSVIAVAFAGFKIAKLLFDVAFNQILLPVIIASDLHNSGRAKKFIQHMLSTYLMFIILLMLIKIYLDISTWAASQTFADNEITNIVVRILILAGSAMGLIDGPDLIARVFGIDAGIKSGMGAVVGTMGAIRTAKGITHTAAAPLRGAVGFVKNGNPVSAFANQMHARKMNDADTKDRWSNFKDSNKKDDSDTNTNSSAENKSNMDNTSTVNTDTQPENTSSSNSKDNVFSNNPIAQKEQAHNANNSINSSAKRTEPPSQISKINGNYRAKPVGAQNYGNGFKMPASSQTSDSSTAALNTALSADNSVTPVAAAPVQTTAAEPEMALVGSSSVISNSAPNNTSARFKSTAPTSSSRANNTYFTAAPPSELGQAAAGNVMKQHESSLPARNNARTSSVQNRNSSSETSLRPPQAAAPNRQFSGYSNSGNDSDIFKNKPIKTTSAKNIPTHNHSVPEAPVTKPKATTAEAPMKKEEI